MENCNLKDTVTSDKFIKAVLLDMEYGETIMDMNIKDNSKRVRRMGMDSIKLRIIVNIMDNLRMIINLEESLNITTRD
jgi:hypothetical protein